MNKWSNCYSDILEQIDNFMADTNNTTGERPNTNGGTNGDTNGEQPSSKPHEPIFNVPGVIICLAGAMIFIHILLNYVVPLNYQIVARLFFAFNPDYLVKALQQVSTNNYAYYYLWSPITHAFLHADWMHLLLNIGFMLAFGAPVAKRLGTTRFMMLFALCAIFGVLFFWVMNLGNDVSLIGASGAVSGFMGAASRFAFQPNIDEMGRLKSGLNVSGPALTLAQCFKDRKFMNFFTIWMVMNILFGTVFSTVLGGSGNIAWEAHIGGFVAGILAFSLLDRR